MKIENLKTQTKTTASRPALRKVRIACSNGPMRFEEMLYSIVSHPGKIRISSRRLQRWLDFRNH